MESDVNNQHPLLTALLQQLVMPELEKLADAPVAQVSAASRDRLRQLMQRHGVADISALDSLPVLAAPTPLTTLAKPLLKALAGSLQQLLELLTLPPGPGLAFATRKLATPEAGTTAPTAMAWRLARFEADAGGAQLTIRSNDDTAGAQLCRVVLMTLPAIERAAMPGGGDFELLPGEGRVLDAVELPDEGTVQVALPAGWAWQHQALGWRAEALDAAVEATALYRQLAQDNPQAFTPNLAMSLNNLGNMLSALGRHLPLDDEGTLWVVLAVEPAA